MVFSFRGIRRKPDGITPKDNKAIKIFNDHIITKSLCAIQPLIMNLLRDDYDYHGGGDEDVR